MGPNKNDEVAESDKVRRSSLIARVVLNLKLNASGILTISEAATIHMTVSESSRKIFRAMKRIVAGPKMTSYLAHSNR
jgi:hypothetical protein